MADKISVMSAFINSEQRIRLAPLQCVNCNAPLVVVDLPSLLCRFCGAANAMPEVYREELRLTRDLDSATRNAADGAATPPDVRLQRELRMMVRLRRRM